MRQPPTPPRDNDQPLTEFLKHHAPSGPTPPPHLEGQIMQAIMVQQTRQVRRRHYWRRTMPEIVAATTVALWASWQWIVPPTLTPQEISELESFMADNWTGSVNRPADPLGDYQ